VVTKLFLFKSNILDIKYVERRDTIWNRLKQAARLSVEFCHVITVYIAALPTKTF